MRRAFYPGAAHSLRRRHHDNQYARGNLDHEGSHSPPKRLLEHGTRGTRRLRHASGVDLSAFSGSGIVVAGCEDKARQKTLTFREAPMDLQLTNKKALVT